MTPNPNLGAERNYEIQDKASLEDSDWGQADADSRFFRVKVSMPQ